jgi:hypothetical protein
MSKTPATPARLTALEARQAELEKRIAELERAAIRQIPAPWTPLGPYPFLPPVLQPISPMPRDDIGDPRCHVCNNRFKDMTNYVCGHPQCPSRVWCGDTLSPTFTCDGTSTAGPYGALGTIGTISKTNPTT